VQLKTFLTQHKYEENLSHLTAHFLPQNFRTLLLKFFFLHHVSHVLPERGREARVHAQGTKTL